MTEISRGIKHRGGGKEMGSEGHSRSGGAGVDVAAARRAEGRRGRDGVEALGERDGIDRGEGTEEVS